MQNIKKKDILQERGKIVRDHVMSGEGCRLNVDCCQEIYRLKFNEFSSYLSSVNCQLSLSESQRNEFLRVKLDSVIVISNYYGNEGDFVSWLASY